MRVRTQIVALTSLAVALWVLYSYQIRQTTAPNEQREQRREMIQIEQAGLQRRECAALERIAKALEKPKP